MLLLNVIEAFDNVFHFRLLHNLRKRRIENIYLTWMKNFLSKRYIILKFIDHIIDRIRTVINISQKFSMSSILYVFYNANLIDWCINSQIEIIETSFIDDINILVMNNSMKENVLILKTIHVEFCMIWAHQHDSLFVSIKYKVILNVFYFRQTRRWFYEYSTIKSFSFSNANISKWWWIISSFKSIIWSIWKKNRLSNWIFSSS
jgi:hypothetical protein